MWSYGETMVHPALTHGGFGWSVAGERPGIIKVRETPPPSTPMPRARSILQCPIFLPPEVHGKELPTIIPMTGFDQSLVNVPFAFPASRTLEMISDENGRKVRVLVRRQEALAGELEVVVQACGEDGSKFTVRTTNRTSLAKTALDIPDEILMRTFASTHTILRTQGAEFVSLTDPPPDFLSRAGSCKNIGTCLRNTLRPCMGLCGN